MKKIGLLGSTGSIGKNTLKIADAHPEDFQIAYLTANTQVKLLIEQAKKYRPDSVVIADESKYPRLREGLSKSGISCMAGAKAIEEMVRDSAADLVLNAISGTAGLPATIAAAEAGRDIALSNKESLVMAGELIGRLCEQNASRILPVDSEHSAIWQCLAGERREDVEKLILTASGGPFLHRDLEKFESITPEEALRHPNWSMGAKITVDSATMFNKGLELIEARHLFHIESERIEILIHPESVIHSMVQFRDGSVKAQLGVPDMKIPIQYALTYPLRFSAAWPRLNLAMTGELHFEEPDIRRFPALRISREALEAGRTYPALLNVANEKAVYRFLKGKILFPEIAVEIEKALEKHQPLDPFSKADILSIAELL
ncbi:MAG: 1-deoxy-D-xylulose-5-phosphate reductoisomerase [Candidatus Neomarinimicrobiota bacterium]|jgi:1-deoxy-D-xylulose-5-phosphate reductoisomerase|nr:1-deoxy-D-xylulose-5-phosphate reductoisomerase [Candidatus Neomarinimicrobiota bacterium]MDD3966258.1 1-deoxy-D-xylulose-5-phosphate reductoisomerase [Candidatus Neomarinimicrobiota bacterium]MDX9780867.1 1-deoxy-D-xylulose-5-phosphate reductoisomerase [bacterium]